MPLSKNNYQRGDTLLAAQMTEIARKIEWLERLFAAPPLRMVSTAGGRTILCDLPTAFIYLGQLKTDLDDNDGSSADVYTASLVEDDSGTPQWTPDTEADTVTIYNFTRVSLSAGTNVWYHQKDGFFLLLQAACGG